MSAYIVSDDHIRYLASAAAFYGVHEDPEHVGTVLLDENYRSVNNRYAEADPAPGYRHEPWPNPFDHVQVIASCKCYDYQACECDDYESTEACKLVTMIQNRALRAANADRVTPLTDDEVYTRKWGAPEPREVKGGR